MSEVDEDDDDDDGIQIKSNKVVEIYMGELRMCNEEAQHKEWNVSCCCCYF